MGIHDLWRKEMREEGKSPLENSKLETRKLRESGGRKVEEWVETNELSSFHVMHLINPSNFEQMKIFIISTGLSPGWIDLKSTKWTECVELKWGARWKEGWRRESEEGLTGKVRRKSKHKSRRWNISSSRFSHLDPFHLLMFVTLFNSSLWKWERI